MKYKDVKEYARKLRLNPTPAEKELWKHIRKKQLEGRLFLRQHPVFYEHFRYESFCFIPDFFCYKEKLAIELDGPIHNLTKEKDERKDAILAHHGIRVLRIQNDELTDIEKVLNKIKQEFSPSLAKESLPRTC
jgi:very-short-patch-repair endonuclease